jgi:hypothetical protein
MQTEYDYSVVSPVAKVDKRKLRELAYMIAGRPAPTIRKPTLYIRRVNANNNGNIQNVYGNNIAAWKTLEASYQIKHGARLQREGGERKRQRPL